MPWANDSDLANYGFLMHTQVVEFPAITEYILVRITLVGIGLSIVGALLSVFLICYVPVRSDSLLSVCNMCIALIGAQLAFAGAENAFPQKIMCKISTAALHYLFLAVHTWSLAFSVHMVLKLYRLLHGKRTKRRFMLVTIGWVMPMLVVATTAVVSGDGYGDERLCWLSIANGSVWAFIGPVCLIASINLLVLLQVLFVQYRHDAKKDLPMVLRIRNLFSTMVTQLPVTNVTWLLGLVPPSYVSFQYIFVLFNASQGMVIFTCHMLYSSQIRTLLKTKLHGVPPGDGQKNELNLSKSDSTGNTQSLEMDIVGEGLRTISVSKKRDP
ncbi:adhesion G protein-coupled receptor L3-like [Physella acuta]|uniref:adhesion G protein-coupled receptor L3-like n=1 Tax=Physella acuta TaxID=109671 RepID=UPI0027DE7A37|nr:adhesion G protein-coupled receptor L3-like [Physella acuta]